MKPGWDDAIARARGLATHLLTPSHLEALAGASDLAGLAAMLARIGYRGFTEPAVLSPVSFEVLIQRSAAERLELLARWCGPQSVGLQVAFEDEERRNLRALLRGVLEGAPPETRLRGLPPTPSLPRRALEELARSPDVGKFGAQLAIWHHPYAEVFTAVAGQREPDLLKLEIALTRTFAHRTREVGGSGDRHLREFVQAVIDVENLMAALVLATEGTELSRADHFIHGGVKVTEDRFLRAAAQPTLELALDRMIGAFARGEVARALRRHREDPALLEDALLLALLREERRALRLDPLGSAPILAFVLGVRWEIRSLQRLVWGLALEAPRERLTTT